MVFPAAVTPYSESGQVDLPQYTRLLAWFQSQGVDGVAIAGTNGEGPSLSAIEKRDLLQHCVKFGGSLKFILVVATNSLTEAKWLARVAESEGISAVLVMPPYFFADPKSTGARDWFLALMDHSSIPVMVYNFPQRTGFAVTAELISSLSFHPNFGGVKDSSGHAENLASFAHAANNSPLYVGQELLLIEALKLGWHGTISGAANHIGGWLSAICKEFTDDPESAEAKFSLISPALLSIRQAPQPYTNKEILRRLGVINSSSVRLPLLQTPGSLVDAAFDAIAKLLPQ